MSLSSRCARGASSRTRYGGVGRADRAVVPSSGAAMREEDSAASSNVETANP
jgi:hypothetical protein